eukprot:symbB.v1.2.029777.t1/scaffold3296.1/size59544/1
MEFAHAVVDRLLAGSSRLPPVYYVGVLREEQKDGATPLETKIYNHWDSSDMAPPKRRPVDAISEPSLEFLGWAQGAPMFPQAAEQKFPEGCPAHAELMTMKKLLVAEFPDAGQQQQQPDRTAPRPSTTRAIGRPDYTIEGGHQPLDVTRVLEKEASPEQPAETTDVMKKPAAAKANLKRPAAAVEKASVEEGVTPAPEDFKVSGQAFEPTAPAAAEPEKGDGSEVELDTTRDIDLDAEGEEEEPKTEDVEVPVEPEAPVEDSQVPE